MMWMRSMSLMGTSYIGSPGCTLAGTDGGRRSNCSPTISAIFLLERGSVANFSRSFRKNKTRNTTWLYRRIGGRPCLCAEYKSQPSFFPAKLWIAQPPDPSIFLFFLLNRDYSSHLFFIPVWRWLSNHKREKWLEVWNWKNVKAVIS